MSTRRVSRKRTYRRTSGSKTMHKVARLEAKKVIKKEIETKMFEGSSSLSAVNGPQLVDNNGINLHLTKDYILAPVTTSNGTSIDQGVLSSQYIGLAITPTYLSINVTIINPGGMTADAYNVLSFMVIQGKGLFIFDQVSTSNQLTYNDTVAAPIGFVPREYNDRYRILYHKRITMDADDPVKTFNIRISGKKLRKIHFSNGLGTIEANPIALSIVSDSEVSPHPTLYATWRLYFKDG